MKIKVVAWNMQGEAENWGLLAEDPDLSDADVYLLCEAAPWEGFLPEGMNAMGHGSTRGIGCECEGEGCNYRTYSTAIASRHALEQMPPGTRVDTWTKKPLPYGPSRVGSWTAGLVDFGGFKLTAIALCPK